MPDNAVDPAAKDKYLLQVTAGPSYDESEHKPVSVNSEKPTCIESDILSAWVHVRIKDYHGLPHDSPPSSSYFDHPQHTSDRYSIAYSFVPKQNMSGSDIVMGFDYGHSIKHQLPPGFRYAMKIATTLLDSGLYSDPYSDQPYLYGPALSSFFAFQIGEKITTMSASDQLSQLEQDAANVIEEGAYGSGAEIRDTLNMPPKWKKRRKFFLSEQALADFTFEEGRMYHADFFNPHLDFANFSLRLPGFSIGVSRYIDDKTHHLRYVLRNRSTEESLIVVIFKLLYGQELKDTLAQERRTSESPAEADEPSGTGHDELPKVCAAEKAEKMAAQREVVRSERPESGPPSPPLDKQTEKGYFDQATTAASGLANSVYVALGFSNSQASTPGSDTSSKNDSLSSSQSMAAEIDKMDNETVERYLQSRNSNA
ncbi:hypothetical protein ACJQWK_01997 [Exserohilum turcicum]|uniref:Domain of unknown function at the cortex 1 domain-containing protein n=1 Tax=Exserohilum turcicum (strain 28A) TaxID=671987 RepID=R0KFT6_EXST2|nr:uncharacterized protein SETTUDRAFT_108150 [Exserohilum turcica Et28A]EOA88154.1 hypothetical protein SETTUDRAFT_108150 [Exserohilum turcica Et28A]